MEKILNRSKAEKSLHPRQQKGRNSCVVGGSGNATAIWADPLSFFCFAVVVEAEMPMIRWQHLGPRALGSTCFLLLACA